MRIRLKRFCCASVITFAACLSVVPLCGCATANTAERPWGASDGFDQREQERGIFWWAWPFGGATAENAAAEQWRSSH